MPEKAAAEGGVVVGGKNKSHLTLGGEDE